MENSVGEHTRRRPMLVNAAVLLPTLPKRYWLNLSDSEPEGLYRVETVEVGRIGRGDMVLLDLPEEFQPYVYGRGWLPEGWSRFKHIGATAGDTYCISESSIAIQRRHRRPGLPPRPLPGLRGCRQVPAGHFLPIATRILRSFDGR